MGLTKPIEQKEILNYINKVVSKRYYTRGNCNEEKYGIKMH